MGRRQILGSWAASLTPRDAARRSIPGIAEAVTGYSGKKTFPGFMMFWGSSALLTRRIRSISTGDL